MLGLCELEAVSFPASAHAMGVVIILCATSMSARGNPSGVRRLVFMSTPCWIGVLCQQGHTVSTTASVEHRPNQARHRVP